MIGPAGRCWKGRAAEDKGKHGAREAIEPLGCPGGSGGDAGQGRTVGHGAGGAVHRQGCHIRRRPTCVASRASGGCLLIVPIEHLPDPLPVGGDAVLHLQQVGQLAWVRGWVRGTDGQQFGHPWGRRWRLRNGWERIGNGCGTAKPFWGMDGTGGTGCGPPSPYMRLVWRVWICIRAEWI